MRTIVALTVMAILVSIVAAVSTLSVAGNIDASTRGSDSVVPVSSGAESAGTGLYTAVCGPDAAHECQTSAG